MEIGISTASYFQKFTTEGAVDDIASHGVRLCEIFLNTFSEYVQPYTDMLARRILDNGIRVYSVHSMSTQFEPQLFSIHPRQYADGVALYRRVLEAAQSFGATHYVMHGPPLLSGAAKNIQLARIVPILVAMRDIAAEYGVTLTLENVSWCILSSPAYTQSLRGAIGEGKLKYTLDVKQALRSGYTPLEYLDAMGTDVENVHLCDAVTDSGGKLLLKMPGHGNFDFAALRSALSQKGYRGPAFIEVYSDMYQSTPALYESLDRMRTVFT